MMIDNLLRSGFTEQLQLDDRDHVAKRVKVSYVEELRRQAVAVEEEGNIKAH